MIWWGGSPPRALPAHICQGHHSSAIGMASSNQRILVSIEHCVSTSNNPHPPPEQQGLGNNAYFIIKNTCHSRYHLLSTLCIRAKTPAHITLVNAGDISRGRCWDRHPLVYTEVLVKWLTQGPVAELGFSPVSLIFITTRLSSLSRSLANVTGTLHIEKHCSSLCSCKKIYGSSFY